MKTSLLTLIGLLAGVLTLPVVATAAPKKILVVTVTTGYRHASIPLGEKVLEQLAATSGQFTVDFVQQPAGEPKAPVKPKVGPEGEQAPAYQAALQQWQAADKVWQAAHAAWMPAVVEALKKLSPENLKAYDAVMFLSTTGDLPLPDKQGFIDWIAAGHAFIGVHSASDTFHGYTPFITMIGGEFLTHGAQVSVDCLNMDPSHAATKPLPATLTLFEEIYQFKNYDRAKVHLLLNMDRHPNNKTPGDYPVSWCKPFGSGRVFYTSLGHREDVWDPVATVDGTRVNPPAIALAYQQHLLGGILWALGLAPGDMTPQSPAAK